jgi:hypothetical protein
MRFGKHRGVPLTKLSGGYLDWLGSKLDEWREPFRSELTIELERRKGAASLLGTKGATTTSARRPRSHRRHSSTPPPPAVCDICGLVPTVQRPLVHASCLNDEVPF